VNFNRVADSIRKRFADGGAILLYHRVTSLERDPQLLAVTPEHFSEHLAVLRRKANVMPLKKFPAAQESGFPSCAVALTFDDGYADNYLEAKPILERYDMPATVFVVSGSVDSDREFWWDDVDRMLLRAEDATWHVETVDSEPRHLKYRAACTALRSSSAGERSRMLAELRTAGGLEPTGRPTHRAMTRDQVLKLAEGGLVDIGAHTATHPVLSTLTRADQQSEIETSKKRLEDLLGKPIESFAYPYGGKKDYTADSVACAKSAGFTLACSNFPALVWRSTNRFQLPRFLVRDCNGDEFERRLDEIFQ
jgi:peptidoglycan/xylan/chitin deacetylase (PgdA/CDA1 family)